MKKTEINSLEHLIERCRYQEKFLFLKKLHQLEKQKNHSPQYRKRLMQLQQRISNSVALIDQKKASIPVISFPEQLPITHVHEKLARLIHDHQVVVVAGETGSGKTTQIPKICLEQGYGIKGLIGHTQPRRIATRAVATRIANELDVNIGEEVGYKIRFDDRSSDKNFISVMTDGVLLAELSSDPLLLKYEVLIIDEAHERSLNIDFILGYLHQLLNKRPELKLIITSATIDPASFSRHFNRAPVLEVSGRTYPVEVRYRPLLTTKLDDESEQFVDIQREPLEALADAITELLDHGPGDILTFMAGERDIRDAAQFLRKRFQQRLEILPLYSRLNRQQQNLIFQTHQKVRVILATNVAETSLTVPGIKYVIDTGVARISRYNTRLKIQQLPVEPISRASANQRKGRCGRTADGICIRLYAEDDFNQRSEFTDAEIHRTHLAAVILKMLALNLGQIEHFPFLEPPKSKSINDGINLLKILSAITTRSGQYCLTKIGKQLSKMPVDPRLGRILVASEKYRCGNLIRIIISGLSVPDVREYPFEFRDKAYQLHKRYHSVPSDFITLVNLWTYIHQLKKDLSQNQFRKQLSKEMLSFLRIRDWIEIHAQLKRTLPGIPKDSDTHYATIHKALLTGFPDQIGQLSPENDYLGARNSRFLVNRQSAIFQVNNKHQQEPFHPEFFVEERKYSKQWILSSDRVETEKIYARYAADIESQWCDEAVPELIKTHYFNPFWSKRAGSAKAKIQKSLFGLIIMANRQVDYTAVNFELSRELFIEEGLINKHILLKIPQIHHLWSLIEEIEAAEDRSRSRDQLIEHSQLKQLLDKKIPDFIANVKQFNKWYKTASDADKKNLKVSKNDLLKDERTQEAYPEFLTVGNYQLPLEYSFQPGSEQDGISVKVPVTILQSLNEQDFEYLIPQYLPEKISALLKSLPKQLRKKFVPVPDYANALTHRINPVKARLIPEIISNLKAMNGFQLQETDFDLEKMPDHLKMNFLIVNEQNELIQQGRNLSELKRLVSNSEPLEQHLMQSHSESEETTHYYQTWPSEEFDNKVINEISGIKVEQYPALAEQNNGVIRQLFPEAEMATYYQNRACIRLVMMQLNDLITYCKNQYLKGSQLVLLFSPMGDQASLLEQINWYSIEILMPDHPVTNKQQFQAILETVRAGFCDSFNQTQLLMQSLLKERSQIKKHIKKAQSIEAIASFQDIDHCLELLFKKDFMLIVDKGQFEQYPKLLSSLSKRLEKLPHSATRERPMIEDCRFWEQQLDELASKINPWDSRQKQLDELWQMYWQLRVSLFTQELGTVFPISVKRLRKAFNTLKSNI